MKKLILHLELIVVAALMFVGVQGLFSSVEAAAEPTIRIGLMTQQFSITLSSDADFEVLDADNGALLAGYAAKTKVRLGLREGQFTLNSNQVTASKIRVAFKSDRVERDVKSLEVNNRRYRGQIEVFRTPGKAGVTVVNALPVDQYVYGILKREISPEWPLEALKAQAVAARTYALYNMGKHKDEGFDLCATSDCQVYGGQEAEDPRVTKAVDDTRGLVMTYGDKIIAAQFHASSGGYTENSENVWENALPYLKGVPDFDKDSPYYRWQKRVTAQELEDALRIGGYNIGQIKAIELSRITSPPVITEDRGVSGRVKRLSVIGSTGVVAIEGTKLRSLLTLQSTLFEISVVILPPASLSNKITDSYGDRDTKEIQIILPPTQEKGLLTDKENIRRITGKKDEVIQFDGYGWGHGVGLSQWGAKAMAERSLKGGDKYFLDILKYYYQGITVEKLF